MADIVAGIMSSHAYTFLDPDRWDDRRQVTRRNYAARYGVMPDERAEVAAAEPEADERRFEAIRDGFRRVRQGLQALRPDVLLLIGDDQDENFVDNLPQLSLFVGDDFDVVHDGHVVHDRVTYRSASRFARHLLQSCVESGFDLASVARFGADNRLLSHAHREPLAEIDPGGELVVVPLFVNAIHIPAPAPRRCYELGVSLRHAIEDYRDDLRIALYASGGMSHFTAGYPWAHYDGPHTVGSIDVEFDARIVAALRAGEGSALADLSSADLLAHGDIELRQTIVMLGALGDRKPTFLQYEAFARALVGMAVGYWEREVVPG